MTKKLYIYLSAVLLMMSMALSTSAIPSEQSAEKSEKARQREKRAQIKSIKEALKNKKGADALKGVENLRTDSAEKWNPIIVQYGVDACRLMADDENMRLYLKNNPDTTAFFNALYRIGQYTLQSDSAESIVAFADSMEGRKAKYRFRKPNAALVSKHLGNILTASRYFAAKAKWDDTERFAAMGIDLMQSAMLKSQKNYRPDTASIINLAVIHNIFFFGRINDYFLRHAQYNDVVEAVKYTLDKVEAEGLLHPDVEEDTLVKHGLSHENIGQFYETLAIASHNQGKFRDCITQSNSVLQWNPQHTRADFFIGASYFRMAEAVKIPESVTNSDYTKNSKERDRLLEMARPHMEIYRKHNPEEARFWAPLLYEIYLYLNLGEEFKEILKHLP